jgi:WD40 repeat protein
MEADCVLATGGYDHTVRLWRPNTGVSHLTFQHPDSVSPFTLPLSPSFSLSLSLKKIKEEE